MSGLWRNYIDTPEGKYPIVLRRDGTVLTKPYFVLVDCDPGFADALFAYAAKHEAIGSDSKFVGDVLEWAQQVRDNPPEQGDPDAPRHREDDLIVIAWARSVHSKSQPSLDRVSGRRNDDLRAPGNAVGFEAEKDLGTKPTGARGRSNMAHKDRHPSVAVHPRCQHGCGNRYRLRTTPMGQTFVHQCVLLGIHDEAACRFECEVEPYESLCSSNANLADALNLECMRNDGGSLPDGDKSITLTRLRKMLKREAEGYRRIAFPTGKDRKHIDRDKQNHMLVARGSYAACEALLENLTSGK